MVSTKKESSLKLKAAQKATRLSKISLKKINISFAISLINYASAELCGVVVRAIDQNVPTGEGIVGSKSHPGTGPIFFFSRIFKFLFFPIF